MIDINARIGAVLSRIREERPLIHHITNSVVMNDTANVTLHLGALPVMAWAAEEVAEMVAQADALLLNLGTPTPSRVESMLIAGRRANGRSIPVVFDPVGVGATTLRLESSLRLLNELDVAVLRGNEGEIAALNAAWGRSEHPSEPPAGWVKGVESVVETHHPAALARSMARKTGATVAITGARDVVSDGYRVVYIDNGHHLLTTITGTGGMATTAAAVFAAVESDALVAASGGLAAFALAAEQAAPKAQGPASFKVALFDQIYALTPERLIDGSRITFAEPSDGH